MTNVAYTQWLDHIQPHVQDCPSPMILLAVRQACIEFCRSSRYLRVNLDPFNTVVGDDEYDLSPPADTVVSAVLNVRCGGRLIDAARQEDLDSEANYWRDLEGPPSRYLLPNEATIILNPVPQEVVAVRILAAIRPSQASGGVDEAIFERFLDPVASGALARLMAMPGVSWSNPELAGYHAQLFKAGVSDAADKAARGLTDNKRIRAKARFM